MRLPLLAAALATAIGAELVRESHDSFLLAAGSDSLAVFATCGLPSQLCAVLLAAVLWAYTAGEREPRPLVRAFTALLGAALLALAALSIGIEGKASVVRESLGAWRVHDFPIDGEERLRCSPGYFTLNVTQGSRGHTFFRGVAPWRVEAGPILDHGLCRSPR